MRNTRPAGAALLAALACSSFACAVNPATGAREFMLVSESQEIQMGLQSDPAVVAQYGLYPDSALQAYVSNLGQGLAARSERPGLPWAFRLVDDPVVNAFALPGGFIYVTRGILAYFNSEAELASVIGHEIGHVTARHSAKQMSQQQVAQVGLVVGAVALPQNMRQYLGIVEQGVGLLFLKFSRDDESQADDLGLRYMNRAGYDPGEMPDVYVMLDRVSQAGAGGRLPTWLSTHPNPVNREARIRQRLDTLTEKGTIVRQDEYVRRLRGLTFGPNPREGFFRGQLFLQPDLRFRYEFPAEWKLVNQKQAVVGQSPRKDAMIQLTLAEGASAQAAATAFLSQEGLRGGQAQTLRVNGLPAVTAGVSLQTEQGTLSGSVIFIEHGGRVYQVLGIAAGDTWDGYRDAVGRSFQSFADLTDRAALAVQPLRLEIVTLDRAMTMEQFHQRYPSQVDATAVALLNGVAVGATLPRGALVKRVVGGPLP